MTEAQPPLVVRIDRGRVRTARARERRILIIGASIELVVAAGIVAAAIWISANSMAFDWFVIGFLGILAVGTVLFAISLLASLRKKGADYWNADGLPDVAFVAHGDGVTISNPETNTTFDAPWSTLKAFEIKRLHTKSVFAAPPGSRGLARSALPFRRTFVAIERLRRTFARQPRRISSRSARGHRPSTPPIPAPPGHQY